jgi:hypothetical protein
MGQNFNRPPTIRIGAGTGSGVLVMGDLTLPHHKIPKAMNDNSGDMHNE